MTYKPEWELLCYPQGEPAGGVILRFGKDEIDCEVDDGSGSTIRPLMLTAALNAQQLGAMNEETFLQFAFDTVSQRELHEVEEWLRIDGKPLKEPHPDRWHRGILGDGTSLNRIVPGHSVQS